MNTKKLPEQDKSLQYQCLVLLDEMTSIGRVPMISQAIAYMAGYNMRLLTIIQSMTQLASAYGKDDAETIRANHSLLIMYAPNPTQQSLANEYSEMLGTQTVKSKSTSKGKGSTSTSESDQRRSLLLPQEIKGIGEKKKSLYSIKARQNLFFVKKSAITKTRTLSADNAGKLLLYLCRTLKPSLHH